jgi:integrase
MSNNERADMRNIKWDEGAKLFRVRVSQLDPRTGIRTNRKGTAVDHRSALEERDRLEREIATGCQTVTADPTLGEYAHSWLERKIPRLRSSNTQKRYADELRIHILGSYTNPRVCLGKLRVRAIVKSDLDDWFLAMANANANVHRQEYRDKKRAEKSAKLVEAGRKPLAVLPSMRPVPYSHATINGTWRTLKQLLQDAVVGLTLSVDPTMGVDPLPEAKRPRSKLNILTGDEIAALLEQAQKDSPFWYAFLAVGFSTGARLGELRPLRWGEDVDLDAGTLLIQQSQRGDYLGETKTRQDRAMELPTELVDILREHREWLRVNHPGFATGLVFPGYGTWRASHKDRPLKIERAFLSKGALDEPLRELCAKAGIKKYVTSHVMRRSFNTLCDSLKVEASVIRSFTGHKTEEMRMLYTDVSDPRRREALAKVTNLFTKKKG